MAHDKTLEGRIREMLAGEDVVEKSMTGGGVGFMVDGKMCVGIRSDGLVVRVGREAKLDLVARDVVTAHRVGNRETSAFVVVDNRAIQSEAALRWWIERGLRFVATLR